MRAVKVILIVAGVGGIGYVAFKYFVNTKRQKVSYLIKNNFSTGTPLQLIVFGDDFINAWYEAAKNGEKLFVLNGAKYNVIGGKQIQ